MGNCNSILSIHEGMGTTQRDRERPALKPDFFLLDERNEESFILFVQRLSKYVKFYNEYNIHESDWSNFYQKESTAILIYLASWNVELLHSTFEITKNEIFINTDGAIQKDKLQKYFDKLKVEFDDFLKLVATIDDEIEEKEHLLASTHSITEKFNFIFGQILATTNAASLLKNYVFIRSTQQLFGLLLSWKNFSKNAVDYQLENYSKHTPHYALFLAFLKILDIAKEKFNEFTKNHLDFYYKDILKIQNKSAQPDYVHLVIEPYANKKFLVPKNTIFPAGKNSEGKNKYYALTADQTINQIKLNSFLSYHRNGNQYFKTTDLLDMNAKGSSFDAFTYNKSEFKEGIMIASPLLFLQSGERIIDLRFNNSLYKSSDFNFYLTGEKSVIEVKDKVNSGGFIRLTIAATEKAIVPYDAKIHTDFLVQSMFPVLKVIPINKNITPTIKTIELNISVNNFKSFVLESDFGIIDVEKPFYPYSEFPRNGNGMTISSNEFFMKKNAIATFGISTHEVSLRSAVSKTVSGISAQAVSKTIDLDNTSSSEIMQAEIGYIYFPITKDWISDRANVFQLNDGRWIDYADQLASVQNIYPLNVYDFDEVATDEILTNGKIRIELNDDAYAGESYMEAYIAASKSVPPLSLPYKPRIHEFTFNYTVSESINLTSRAKEKNKIDIFQVLPFGYNKKEKGAIHFTNLSNKEGFIYLGFDTIGPKDALSFLIQLEEGTANPMLAPATIAWHFLSDKVWKEFEADAIGDETYALTQSGIVNISVPSFEAKKNTVLPKDIFWVRLSISNIHAICKFLGIHVQACKAVLTDFENEGLSFLENTPKETIDKSYKAINDVKKITQPYSSFLGRIAESDNTLYTRTSERLRHKNRAITTWDYERIVLEEFPEVYRLKSLNHYRYDTKTSNVSAGYMTLIAIAKASKSANIAWKPMLSLNKMMLIKERLSKKSTPHVRLNVKPPRLEKVHLHFKVKFHVVQGMDTRLYIGQLKHTINQYLSPWAYDDKDFNFANAIEFSSIIQLIDNQDYVDYITDFKVDQYKLDENNDVIGGAIQNLSKIEPQSDFTLFIPTDTHTIIEI